MGKSAKHDEDSGGNVDDQFRAIMEGLRTTLPGAQVMVAFLLTLPLQGEFASMNGAQRAAYYVAFATSLISSVLLIAPSVHQRMRVPKSGVERRHAAHVHSAIRLTIVGTLFLLVALTAVAFLVTSLVFSLPYAITAAAVLALVASYTWLYQPLVQFD